jgi:predicted NAD/FAD-dependent oxidoreductase
MQTNPRSAVPAPVVPTSATPVVVVGAGISGVACARELAAAGVPVRLVDRGRRIGGRMGSKRLADRPVDLGASYLTVSDPAFATVVADWERRGLARPWTDTFTVLDAGEAPTSKAGPVRWGAPGALRSLVEDLATGLDVEQRAIEVVDRDATGRLTVDDEPAAAVVLAMPDEQARRLLGPGVRPEAPGLDRPSEPIIALAAWWDERTWDGVSPDGRFHGAFVNGDADLGWIADDGRRRGDDAPVLVAHSTPDLAARHLERPEGAGPPMLAALQRLLGLGDPAGTHVHRWSLARPTGEREAAYHLGTGAAGAAGSLGVCGDGWGRTPKVEGAWLSGRDLGRALVERLG